MKDINPKLEHILFEGSTKRAYIIRIIKVEYDTAYKMLKFDVIIKTDLRYAWSAQLRGKTTSYSHTPTMIYFDAKHWYKSSSEYHPTRLTRLDKYYLRSKLNDIVEGKNEEEEEIRFV